MISNINSIKNKRAFILITFIIIVSSSFWSISRYPALVSKSELGHRMDMLQESMVEDKIAHRAKYKYDKNETLTNKIYYTTLNWINANLRGMSYGLVIGVALLTLFQYLKKRSSGSRFINSLLGMFGGIPLGVCSNCVAPIAKGLYEGGAKPESALALLFSSPTLNVIVVTMVISLFPLKLALLKIAASILLIAVIVPLISMQKMKSADIKDEGAFCPMSRPIEIVRENWVDAFKGSLLSYIKNFIYLFIRVVPLMILAGFLGSVISHTLPLEDYANMSTSFKTLLAIALIGAFMPMPIAVDILLAESLWIAGFSLEFVMVVLITLGSYSIYSCIIVAQAFGTKIAIQLYFIVVCLGLVAQYFI